MPSDKKIWMGYEAHPNEYVKAEDGGFDRKPEYRAEQEAKLGEATAEEIGSQARAVAQKRAERRTSPMDPVELTTALAKARLIAEAMEETQVRAEQESRQAEIDSWVNNQARA